MPKKSKITAVPIEQPVSEEAVSEEAEPKTDAQEMTDVLNQVKVVSEPVDVEPVAVEQEAPKAKAKRASRAKAQIGRAHV